MIITSLNRRIRQRNCPVKVPIMLTVVMMAPLMTIPECNIIMPVKRRKNHSALTRAEKRFNRKHSRIRILVEHVLSRMKNIKFWLRYTVIKSWITISDLEILLPSSTSGWQLLLFKINVSLMVFPKLQLRNMSIQLVLSMIF